MSQLPPNVESKFRLVHIASRRAEQLVQGARQKVESRYTKMTRIALDEVNQDLVKWGLAGTEPVAELEGVGTDPLPTEAA
jgi:DNA-directed RNA polymerase omega subunit